MTRQKRQTKESVHYVNNKEFTAAIIKHNHACRKAEKDGVEKPRVTEYIGECIYKIATRLSTKPNFINYSYRDEMICDGIENCLQYIENFNEEKSQNAFAYVTHTKGMTNSFVDYLQENMNPINYKPRGSKKKDT